MHVKLRRTKMICACHDDDGDYYDFTTVCAWSWIVWFPHCLIPASEPQCPADTTPLVLPSAILSKGSNKLQAAVNTKMTAEVKTGRFGEIANKNPAETGAMIPVLVHRQLCSHCHKGL